MILGGVAQHVQPARSTLYPSEGLYNMTSDSLVGSDIETADLRPLGPFEQSFHYYVLRNPTQLSVVGRLNAAVDEPRLRTALVDLQRIHPLLAAAVIDSDEGPPAFRHVARAIPLRVGKAESRWEDAAAEDQTRPINGAAGPLVRATSSLARRGRRSC